MQFLLSFGFPPVSHCSIDVANVVGLRVERQSSQIEVVAVLSELAGCPFRVGAGRARLLRFLGGEVI